MLKNQKGVTLLEVLIAVAILAMIIGPYFSKFIQATEIGERSERVVRAEFVAQDYLEREKRLPNIPVAGNKNIINDIDSNMRVEITYSDQTGQVEGTAGDIQVYSENTTKDLVITPTNVGGDVELSITNSSDVVLVSSISVPDSEVINIILSETTTNDLYDVKYSVAGGSELDIGSVTKLAGEIVRFSLDSQKLLNEPPSSITFNIVNLTSGIGERNFQLYEYDDTFKVYDIVIDGSSTGSVELYLKLDSDPSVTLNNDLNYYWVKIEVFDETDELLAELYSSIRKE